MRNPRGFCARIREKREKDRKKKDSEEKGEKRERSLDRWEGVVYTMK